MNRQDCLRSQGSTLLPFVEPGYSSRNLSSPSPHPYIDMGMVMIPTKGVPQVT
jgi:hypothetical protein